MSSNYDASRPTAPRGPSSPRIPRKWPPPNGTRRSTFQAASTWFTFVNAPPEDLLDPTFDEAIDDANLAKLFGDVKHEVSRSCTLGEFSGKADPDDFGQFHRDGLAEHRGFGLDATDAPADDPQPADWREQWL